MVTIFFRLFFICNIFVFTNKTLVNEYRSAFFPFILFLLKSPTLKDMFTVLHCFFFSFYFIFAYIFITFVTFFILPFLVHFNTLCFACSYFSDIFFHFSFCFYCSSRMLFSCSRVYFKRFSSVFLFVSDLTSFFPFSLFISFFIYLFTYYLVYFFLLL